MAKRNQPSPGQIASARAPVSSRLGSDSSRPRRADAKRVGVEEGCVRLLQAIFGRQAAKALPPNFRALSRALNTLDPRERQVLIERYGIEDGRLRTLQEIGNAWNLTRERIRQIELKGILKMRHPNRSRGLTRAGD